VPENRPSKRTMTKADLVERVHDQIGFSKKEAGEVVESLFESIKVGLTDGDKVKIAGFGNFLVRQKAGRKGRNPQTSEALWIPPRRVITFKPSQLLRAALNDELDG